MKSILICDDSTIMRMMIRKIINSTGQYIVVGDAYNGEDAVNKF